MKKLSIVTLVIIALTSGRMSFVMAAEEKNAGINTVEQNVNDLLLIRDDDSLSDKEKAAKEIEVKTKILEGVLSLSLDEVKNLNGKLKDLPEFPKDSQEKKMQEGFMKSLEVHAAYYNEELNKLALLQTLAELRNMAEEVKKYRETVYNSDVQKIVEFALVFYSENVLGVSNNRLDKISGDIKKLSGMGYIRAGAFDSQMAKAKDLLELAAKLQKQAKEIVLKVPDGKDMVSDNAPAELIIKDGEVKKLPAPTNLMGDSLNKIKEAYGIFLQISKDVRKALGIK
ncbi:MAG: hypothetical protein HYR95_02545 [Candidatus Colwellbacteria bacterium]|nr:hypothetical protein [Candidatus Colwellbacteria bacterium]